MTTEQRARVEEIRKDNPPTRCNFCGGKGELYPRYKVYAKCVECNGTGVIVTDTDFLLSLIDSLIAEKKHKEPNDQKITVYEIESEGFYSYSLLADERNKTVRYQFANEDHRLRTHIIAKRLGVGFNSITVKRNYGK